MAMSSEAMQVELQAGRAGSRDARLRRYRLQDALFMNLTRAFAVLTLVTLAGIIVSLIISSWPSIQTFGLSFLWTSDWNAPAQKFGALIPIYGTLVTSVIALVIAV